MRPTKLTMRAFGSYAGETAVDFDRLTGGLYLIVGKTGAGKTTIFDAVSFALFGKPSGSERTADMLHSDFVPLSEDTVVTLDFLHQGRSYHVVRSIHFQKKRAGEGYGDGKINAEMTGGGEALEGATAVTLRCTELLGLNAEQFRRIVMLAQGEFREFLRAGSDKKNEILGKLFDNGEYLRFQNLLGSVRDSLRRERAERETELRTVMQSLFRMPERGENPEDYQYGHPRLTENLAALVRTDEAEQAELQEALQARNRAVEDLTRREGAAELDNALLEELEQKRRVLAELEAGAERIAAARREYDAAERALHRVVPRREAELRAQADLRQTREEIARKKEQLRQQQIRLAEARAAAEADEPKRREAEGLTGEAARLSAALPRYADLEQSSEKLSAGIKALQEQQGRAGELEAQLADLAEELAARSRELLTLEGSDGEAARAEQRVQEARARLEELTAGDTGILARVEAVLLREGELVRRAGELREATEAAAGAEAEHHALYQRFLQGQAGLIAAGMERELQETGKTVCPVCRTPFCREEKHHFALPEEHIPTKEDVDRAEASAREAEKRRQDAALELETQRTGIQQSKDAVAAALKRLRPDCAGWGMLTAPEYLPGLRREWEEDLARAEKAHAAARVRRDRRQTLLREEPKIRERQRTLEDRSGKARQAAGELELEIRGLESGLRELRQQLELPDLAAAKARLAELTRRRAELQAAIDAHERERDAARAAADGTEGGLRTLEEALPGLEEAAANAAADLTRALTESGFPDQSAAEAALAPMGGGDGERWLTARKQELDDYAREKAAARERIRELQDQTAGKSPVDLEALTRKLKEARDAQKLAAGAAADQKAVLDGHRTVLERVREAKDALAGTDEAWRRISGLADLALGVNSEGGRLSFDRYVMGAIFREVLEMANRRLDVMTGGRFALIHTVEAGRNNAVAGLEVEVLDRETGRQRASGSISGGEGFMVSLALALGLSDVVQSHAGGQKLDTLFIDEGFGTLDDGKLDNVISVLQQLTEGNRLVGVISHVDKLEESIPQKLRVVSGPGGSALRLELS